MHHEEVDEIQQLIEFSTSRTKAEEYEAVARDLAVGEYGRAAFLVLSAEHWQMRGDLARARALLIEAGWGHPGELILHPLSTRLSVELAAGDSVAQETVLTSLLERWRAAELTIATCSYVGELLEIDGQLKRSHRWYTLPLTNVDPDDEIEVDEELCILGRARVRRQLGLAEDRFDGVAAEIIADRELSTD